MASVLPAQPGDLRVRDALSPQLAFCLASTPIAQLAKVMAENRVRELPVIVDQRVLGFVSYADVMQRFVEGRPEGTAADITRQPVLTLQGDTRLSEAISLMQKTGRESVVATADGTLPIGAVTPASILGALMPAVSHAERR